ncbi:transmembrane sensor [Polymorphobacter multimanifer]|uniref:Transmembrane sensor n=1 Tax=Polymorphobacter multimanifer TaxID=1070431 RepID=A0A841L875_9SPHN|nr:transmembrane sensor [Polymorphobacter multimanifer]
MARYSRIDERERLEDEAARRFLAARASGSDDDWAEAYAWIAEHPAHGVAFAKAEAAWEISGRLKEVAPRIDPEAIAGPAGRFEAVVGRRQVIAAIFATAFIGTAATVAVQKASAVVRYRTAVGEARRFRLEDGSSIFLNTNSAVEIAIRERSRFVRLLRGEASFIVAADHPAPLVIDAEGTTLQARGGGFNVRLRPDVLELTVVDGMVRVAGLEGAGSEGRGDVRVVAATQGAAIRGGSVAMTALSSMQAARRLAWQSGIVEFRGETLAQAVDEFNRYRVSPLVIGDPEIASVRVEGRFRVGASDQFIGLLSPGLGIRQVVGADRSVLLLRAPGFAPDLSEDGRNLALDR